MSAELLHPELFRQLPFAGYAVQTKLEEAAREAERQRFSVAEDLSVVVRMRDSDLHYIDELFDDIEANEANYPGHVQKIAVISGSHELVDKANDRHFKTMRLPPKLYTHPMALNMGFEEAKHRVVLSLVGHSALTNTATFIAATNHTEENFGAIYSTSLPGRNASWSERLGALGLRTQRRMTMRPVLVDPKSSEPDKEGFMAAESVAISREAWEQAGKFDLSFAAGGESGQLGRYLQALGYNIYRNSPLAVFHTHGLDPLQSWRQAVAWRKMGQPHEFHPTLMSECPEPRPPQEKRK